MIIIHPIDTFLEELFPGLRGNLSNEELILKTIADYYTFQNIRPTIKISNGLIEVHINTNIIVNQQIVFGRAVKLCETNKFKDAIPILLDLIQKNPSNSEYYRTLGQAYSMIGDQDSAINFLIDALRWNPKNNYALIMIGNIFARNKNDIDTAKKYYQQVIENNPNDAIAINNLGTNLIQAGKIDEGLEYLRKANSINPDYPNSLYGIGLVNQMKGNNPEAFRYAHQALKKCSKSELELSKHALSLMFETAIEVSKTPIGKNIFEKYRTFLENKSHKEIRVEIDDDIDTAAKFEFAENYKRDFHLVKYKSKYPAVYHLILHELVHLDLALDARAASSNKLFVSNNTGLRLFIDFLKPHRTKLLHQGLKEESISNYYNSLFEGLNLQIFNTPIDLFIEDKLFEEYQDLRPLQFISLYSNIKEGIKATTTKDIVRLSPPSILQTSKILNIINALHFKDLFSIDLIEEFNPSILELKQAKKLYEEFYEYRDDREPGEEYELVENWGKDLNIDKYFNLVDENVYRKGNQFDEILEKIERDPYDLESHDPEKEREMEDFQRSQKEIGTNMAVVMFMVDALQYFEGMPKNQIKEIAYEIAMQGTQGYRPENKNYTLSKVPNKTFSGYHILAYYYVSWTLAIPDMVSQLKLPYDNEYSMALTLFKPKKHE